MGYKPISQFSILEERLFYWLHYYDIAYSLIQYEEYLNDDVINDNLRLDAFYMYFDEKRKNEKVENIERQTETQQKSINHFKGNRFEEIKFG